MSDDKQPAASPQSDILMRPLQQQDYDKGFLQILSQLTTVGDISADTFQKTFSRMLGTEDCHVLVLEDTTSRSIVGTATLFVLQKFIHECGKVGLIEDVVVDSSYRGRKLGQRLIDGLTELGQKQGCYKVMLNCAESNIGFYSSCGYKRKEVQMVKYYE